MATGDDDRLPLVKEKQKVPPYDRPTSDAEVRAFIDRALDGPPADSIHDDMLQALPAEWELERMRSKLALARLPQQPPVEIKGDDTLATAARNAQRFQERWEKTISNVFRRYWERRESLLRAKISSVQFRRGTALWDPPGDTPLVSRLSLLVDEAAWDRELTEDMTRALVDLHTEAVEALDILQVKEERPDIIEFIRRWIAYTLGFNRSAAAAVKRILEAEPQRVTDLEQSITDYVAATASMVGDRMATSISTGATNQAQEEAARRHPATLEKIWFSSQDGRVRHAHRAAAGQRVPIGGSFRLRDSKGVEHEMRYPGDISAPRQLWINCRCVCLFTFADSGDIWQRPDGSPVDPYGRATLSLEPKRFAPSDLGVKALD
jgi:hypothetical protein